jgi:hypothetical protein
LNDSSGRMGARRRQGGEMAGQMVHVEIPAGSTAKARSSGAGSSAGSSRRSRGARPSTT